MTWQDQRVSLGSYAGHDILIRFDYQLGSYYPNYGVWIDDIEVQFATWYTWDTIQSIDELTSYREQRTTVFSDPADDFTAFTLSSDNHNKDWVLSPDGASGSCFFKAASFDPGPSYMTSKTAYAIESGTVLTFQAKYILAADVGRVAVSTDQGTSFTPVWSQTNLYRNSWTNVQVPLDDYAGQNILIRIEYLPGNQAYTNGGGIWIDNIRLETVTGSEYRNHPIYYAPAPDLTPGKHILAYRVITGNQVHGRSDAFTIIAP